MSGQDTLIERLRAGLEGTTPGEWATVQLYDRRDIDRPFVVGPSEVVVGTDGICEPAQMNDRQFVEDAANMRHIANCSPHNIRLLLSEIDSLRSRCETLERENEKQRQRIAKLMAQNVMDVGVAESRLAMAEAALEPFAAYSSLSGFDRLPDNMPLTPGSGIAARQVTVGDFRRAARSISHGEDKTDG